MTTTIQDVTKFASDWRQDNGISDPNRQLTQAELSKLAADLNTWVAAMDFASPKAGASAIAYSGQISEVEGWRIAAEVSASSGGKYTYISDFEPGQLLNDLDFKEALLKAVGGEDSVRDAILNGTKGADGIRIPSPDGITPALNDFVSKGFMEANAVGRVLVLTPAGFPDNVWVQTEYPHLLNDGRVTFINDTPRVELLNLRDSLVNRGLTLEEANKAILDKINFDARIHASYIEIAYDAGTRFVGTDKFFARIAPEIVGSPLPAGLTPVAQPGFESFLKDINSLTPEAASNVRLATEMQRIEAIDHIAHLEATAPNDLATINAAREHLTRVESTGRYADLGKTVADGLARSDDLLRARGELLSRGIASELAEAMIHDWSRLGLNAQAALQGGGTQAYLGNANGLPAETVQKARVVGDLLGEFATERRLFLEANGPNEPGAIAEARWYEEQLKTTRNFTDVAQALADDRLAGNVRSFSHLMDEAGVSHWAANELARFLADTSVTTIETMPKAWIEAFIEGGRAIGLTDAQIYESAGRFVPAFIVEARSKSVQKEESRRWRYGDWQRELVNDSAWRAAA